MRKNVSGFFVVLCAGALFVCSCASGSGGSSGGGGGASSGSRFGWYSSLEPQRVNPLKGFACWEGSSHNSDWCSLEYIPVPFDEVLTAKDTCTKVNLEKKLESAKSRRHQAIVRVVIDDTGKALRLPAFIKDNITLYTYNRKGAKDVSPDYDDEKLLSQMEYFIKWFGENYDGDPRIACIETGLIGHWGEHHIYYAKDVGQTIADSTWKRVFGAYGNAFKETHLSVRYPKLPGIGGYPRIGFFNDTVYTDKSDADFMRDLAKYGMQDRWKTAMNTGEFTPALQESFFSQAASDKAVFDKYTSRVRELHLSSLLCNKAFKSGADGVLVRAASAAMGYDFTVSSAKLSASGGSISVSVTIKNQGAAPFYYDWPVKLAVPGKKEIDTKWRISTVTAGGSQTFSASIEGAAGDSVLLAIPNPMPGGYPVSFSNNGQDKDKAGWLTLGKAE